MAYIIKIRNLKDLDKSISSLKGIHSKLPEMTSKAMLKWGNQLVGDIRQSARLARIQPFTGELLNGKGIRWEQRPNGKIGRLFIRLYGIALDKMKSHWVNITPNRTRLLLWAGQADDSLINNAATLIASGKIKKRAIFVRPHPYIRNGYNIARPKIRMYIKQEVKNGLNQAIGG